MNIFLHLSSLFFDVEVYPLAVIRSHCFRAVRTYAPLRFAGLADGLIVFGEIALSSGGMGFEFPLKPLPHQKFIRRDDEN